MTASDIEKQALYDFLAKEMVEADQKKRMFRATVKRRLVLIFLTFAICACVLSLAAGDFAFLDHWNKDRERIAKQKLALLAMMGSFIKNLLTLT